MVQLFPPGRVAQSVGHLTRKSGVLGSIPGLATYFRFSFRFFKEAVVSYWRKYVHEVLVNRLGGLSLPRKSVVRFTDRPDMTLDVYRGRKTTIQQQQLFPVGIWCKNDDVSTSMRRHHVASTSIQRHFYVMGPLGRDFQFSSMTDKAYLK